MVFKKLLPKTQNPSFRSSIWSSFTTKVYYYFTRIELQRIIASIHTSFWSPVWVCCVVIKAAILLSLSLRLRIYIIIIILFSEDWWLIYMVHFWQHCALWRFIAVVDSIYKLHLAQGLSINDVTHFLRCLTPSSALVTNFTK